MKLPLALCACILILITLSASHNAEDENVDLIGLVNKDFKCIIQFNEKSTAEEISSTEKYLRKFNSSINLTRSVNPLNGNVSFEIKSDGGTCKSSNFEMGIIFLDKNDGCQCAIGDKSIEID